MVVLFLSARQFGDERRVDPLRDRLAEEGLAAEPLRLELTDATVMADIDPLRELHGDPGQGFGFGAPMPPADIGRLL